MFSNTQPCTQEEIKEQISFYKDCFEWAKEEKEKLCNAKNDLQLDLVLLGKEKSEFQILVTKWRIEELEKEIKEHEVNIVYNRQKIEDLEMKLSSSSFGFHSSNCVVEYL